MHAKQENLSGHEPYHHFKKQQSQLGLSIYF